MACAPRWKTPRGTSEAPSHRHRPAVMPEWLTHCQRSARQQPVRCTPRCGHNRPRPAHHLPRRPHSTGNAADTPTLASSEAALRKGCLQRSARQPAHPMHAAHPGQSRHLRTPPRLTAHTPRRPGGYRQPPGWTGRVAAVRRHKDAGQGQRTATAARRPITPARATHAMRPYAQGTAQADTGSRQAASAAVRQPTLDAGQHRLRCWQTTARPAQPRRETGG